MNETNLIAKREDVKGKAMVDSLKEISDATIATLSEEIFREVFIPFFAKDPNPKYPVTLARWIAHAGGVFMPVKIVDTDGNVLFTVPPIFDSGIIKPIPHPTMPIAAIVDTANLHSTVHPLQGQKYLETKLMEQAPLLIDTSSVPATVNAWNAIFARYGREPMSGVSETAVRQAKPLFDDDFEPL